MVAFLTILFFVALLVQLIYWGFIYSRLLWHQNSEDEPVNWPSVSVVIAAWNEIINLQELLPILEEQDYPNFEIIVADDRSYDGTYDLLWIEQPYKKVKIVRIDQTPPHFTNKKYAVTMGIKKASNDIILLTDADCRPTGPHWIKEMVRQYKDNKQIVIGFSPYHEYEGMLNRFIRFETFHTAVQYLSLAKIGLPFMAVGRNLSYIRDFFWTSNAFASHHGVLGGDDDLFVNANGNSQNVGISLSYDSLMYSEPKRTFDEWLTQKRRHLSVGKFYKLRDKIILGLYSFSQIFSWVLLPVIFFAEPWWFQAPEWARIPNNLLDERGLADFYPFTDWMRFCTGILVCWLLIKHLIMSRLNNKLFKTIKNRSLLWFDFLHVVYLLTVGIYSFFSQRQKIRWK